MSHKYTVTIQRAHLIMASAFLKTIKAPGAFLLGKLTSGIDNFLKDYPGDKYRLTAETIDDEISDRESSEEQANPREKAL
jgi:hypothetical protein